MPARFRRLLPAGLLLLPIAGCAGGSVVDTSVAGGLGYQPGHGIVMSQGHRYSVGDVSGTTLEGRHVDLAALRGKVVVINFWGSWCADCRAETDAFNQVARDDAHHGVAFLGINIRDNEAAARSFESAHRVPYPSIYDRNGTLALQFPHAVPAATPTTIVVDPSGRIAAKVSGALEYTQLRSLVKAVQAPRT